MRTHCDVEVAGHELEEAHEAVQQVQLEVLVVGDAVQHRADAALHQLLADLGGGHERAQARLRLCHRGGVRAGQLLEQQGHDVLAQGLQLTTIPASRGCLCKNGDTQADEDTVSQSCYQTVHSPLRTHPQSGASSDGSVR